MKVDRILFCLNNNPNYIDFWNINSKIWRLKFDVIPTLFFVGDEKEVEELNLSKEFGEIIVLPDIKEDLCNGHDRKWYITWALFYGASLFPNDICMTSGIDQIPLSDIFLKRIEDVSDDKYVVGFADAYGIKDFYPSSHHVATGKLYKKKFEITDDWAGEVQRLYEKRGNYKNLYDSAYWGLDENYTSEMITKMNSDVFFNNDFFHPTWKTRRIDRAYGLKYEFNKLMNGWYTELHAPRPFSVYSSEIDKIVYLAHKL